MKIVALDIGDAWTGTAISDALGMFARPLQTVATTQLEPFLTTLINQEPIGTVVVGHPKTMRGTTSDQTLKVEQMFEQLKTQFSTVTWILWDERLSSKRADTIKKGTSKEDKLQSHSRAAAFILASYLDYQHIQKNNL